MGIRSKLALFGAVAVMALPSMKSQASVDDNKLNVKSIRQEVLLDKKQNASTTVQEESKSLVDAIQRGEKVTHGSIVLDMPKLKELQKKGKLTNFEILYEGEKVGLKFHDDGKRGLFEKNESAKDYIILMPRQNFEIFLAAMFRKEIKTEVKEQPINPKDRVFEDIYARFFVEKDGVRSTMTSKKDAQNMLNKTTDVFCDLNSEGVVNIGNIVKGYANEIREFGGWIGEQALNLIGASSWAQNRLIQNIIRPFFEKDFTDMALNSEKKRERALEEFNKEKEKAIKEYEDLHDPVKMALREKERQESLQTIDELKQAFVEKRNGETRLKLFCGKKGDKVVFINTQKDKITSQQINYFDDSTCVWRNLEPEEWSEIGGLFVNELSNENKIALGEDFFKAVCNTTGIDLGKNFFDLFDKGDVKPTDNASKLNPAVVASLNTHNNK